MSRDVISDNWALQVVADLIANGIDKDEAHWLVPKKNTDSHEYQSVVSGIVAIEALLDLIADVVLRDQILVDEQFSDAWNSDDSSLKAVAENGVIRPYPFLLEHGRLIEPRDEFVTKLCVTSSLKEDHEKNVVGWQLNRNTPDRYLSQILWGGAGMLARAYVYERAYTPHPVRRRLFQSAGVALADDDSVVRFTNVLEAKRASIRAYQSSNDQLCSLKLSMGALPLIIVREANSPKDILNVALQVRGEYRELREWLGEFHNAIAQSDVSEIAKHQKVLKDISDYVDSRLSMGNVDGPTFTVGVDILKVAMKGRPINTLRNQFGIRSMVNKLMLGSDGAAEMKKLLKIFGHEKSKIGLQITDHFSKK